MYTGYIHKRIDYEMIAQVVDKETLETLRSFVDHPEKELSSYAMQILQGWVLTVPETIAKLGGNELYHYLMTQQIMELEALESKQAQEMMINGISPGEVLQMWGIDPYCALRVRYNKEVEWQLSDEYYQE